LDRAAKRTRSAVGGLAQQKAKVWRGIGDKTALEPELDRARKEKVKEKKV
jgi:hypothetical protein